MNMLEQPNASIKLKAYHGFHAGDLESVLEKARLFDILMNAQGAIDMGATAQSLRMGRNTIMKRLRDERILQKRNNRPYQRYIDLGYFVVTPYVDASNRLRTKTLVTARGLTYIQKQLIKGEKLS